jgi:hypothetical protein
VQGYIPVLFNAPVAAPVPQGPQGAAAAPQQQPQQQQPPRAQPDVFGVRGRHFFDFGNPFNFGGDGAADYNQPQPQLPNPALANFHNNNPGIVGPMAAHPNLRNVQMPGAWSNPNDGGHAVNDWQQQLRLLELENIRRVHDQRVQEGQQADRIRVEMNVNRNNQQVHPAYQDYEQEMRWMGFPQGR